MNRNSREDEHSMADEKNSKSERRNLQAARMKHSCFSGKSKMWKDLKKQSSAATKIEQRTSKRRA